MKDKILETLGSIYDAAFTRRDYVFDAHGFAEDRANLLCDVTVIGHDLEAGLLQSEQQYGKPSFASTRHR